MHHTHEHRPAANGDAVPAPTPAERQSPPAEPRWPVGLAEGITDRLDAASAYESLISADDARTIAACLTDYLDLGAHSALRRYANASQLDGPRVRAECLAARADHLLPSQLARWTAWLTTYAANALPPGDGGAAMPTNGDTLNAFLGLPDIDPSRDDLLMRFLDCYCGSYADIDDVLDGATEITTWEREINRVAEDLGVAEFVFIDREAIAWFVRDGWEVVEHHGRLHVFLR